MATTKPRITVTLTERQHAVLKSISDSSGQPMSQFISEILEPSMPTLERMAAAFQKISAARHIQRERFVESLDQAQTALEPIVQQALGQFDLFMAQVEQAAVAAPTDRAGDATGGGAAASPPPSTNRGDTPPAKKKGKQPQAARGKVSQAKRPQRARATP